MVIPRVSIAILAAALAAAAVQGAGEKSILGRVWTGTQPVAQVTVVLENQYGSPVAQTISDREGRFNFDSLNGGSYRLAIDTPDFLPLARDVEVDNDQVTVALFLHARPGEVGPVPSLGGYSLSSKAENSFAAGQKFMAAGRYRQAVAPLVAAVAAAPGFAAGYVALGNAFWATRDRSKAETSWRKALALEPQNAEAAIDLARLDNDRRQWRAALTLLTTAQARARGAWTWHLERGRSEYGLRQWSLADADLQASLPAAGKVNPGVFVLLSNLDLKSGRVPEARAMLESYLRAAPHGPFAARARSIVQQMIARGVPDPPSAR